MGWRVGKMLRGALWGHVCADVLLFLDGRSGSFELAEPSQSRCKFRALLRQLLLLCPACMLLALDTLSTSSDHSSDLAVTDTPSTLHASWLAYNVVIEAYNEGHIQFFSTRSPG